MANLKANAYWARYEGQDGYFPRAHSRRALTPGRVVKEGNRYVLEVVMVGPCPEVLTFPLSSARCGAEKTLDEVKAARPVRKAAKRRWVPDGDGWKLAV